MGRAASGRSRCRGWSSSTAGGRRASTAGPAAVLAAAAGWAVHSAAGAAAYCRWQQAPAVLLMLHILRPQLMMKPLQEPLAVTAAAVTVLAAGRPARGTVGTAVSMMQGSRHALQAQQSFQQWALPCLGLMVMQLQRMLPGRRGRLQPAPHPLCCSRTLQAAQLVMPRVSHQRMPLLRLQGLLHAARAWMALITQQLPCSRQRQFSASSALHLQRLLVPGWRPSAGLPQQPLPGHLPALTSQLQDHWPGGLPLASHPTAT